MTETPEYIQKIRADFPILQSKVHNKPLVYFDNAATSQTPVQVINTIVDYYKKYNANIHRGVHSLSQEATDAYEAARKKIQKHFNSLNFVVGGVFFKKNKISSHYRRRYFFNY